MPCNLVLIGCGAITRSFYLPALARLRRQFDSVFLIEPNDEAVVRALNIVNGERVRCLSDIECPIHFAIVAAPNHLHFDLAQECLSMGANVLIEKPFVVWPDEGRKLIRKAEEATRLIAVNQTRRFFTSSQHLRQQIESGAYGVLKAITHDEGVKLNWPFESGAAFAKTALRTGVIMDFGVHAIDFYYYLFRPKWAFAFGINDGFDGPEGLAAIHLTADGKPVSIRLSRYYPLSNVAQLSFEYCDVLFSIYNTASYFVKNRSGDVKEIRTTEYASTYADLADDVLLNFLAAGRGEQRLVCDAESSLPSIEILDYIYRSSTLYPAGIGTV
jgi:predicted dehydrogenase